MDQGATSETTFSVTRGGPLYSLLQRTGIVRPGRRDVLRQALFFVAITWGPLALISAVQRLGTETTDVVSSNPAVHARLLVALPLLFLSESLVDQRCAKTFRRLVGEYVDPATDVGAIVRRSDRLRDAVWAEVAMALVAWGLGSGVLWGMSRSSGFFHDIAVEGRASAPLTWYALFALPVFNFLLFRLLYRWGIWSSVLFAFARTKLHPVSTHPDRAGGLDCLSEPAEPFALTIMAVSAVVAARWEHLVEGGRTPASLVSGLVLLAVGALAISLGPLLAFSSLLWRARIEGVEDYSRLAHIQAKAFHQKWIVSGHEESVLGSPDVSSLCDMGTNYEKVDKMRFVPFGVRSVVVVLAAIVLPMLPLLALQVPLPTIFAALLHATLGDVPP